MSRSAEQPVLSTRRLTLRPFRAEDAARVQALAALRDVADTTLTIPHPYPEGGAATWIATHRTAFEAGDSITWAITDAATGELFGAIALSLSAAHARGELGYWIDPSYWNRGFATEAAAAVLGVAFGPLGLHRVEARHFARNPASGRVMQKLGMQLEGLHRQALRKNGQFEDVAFYGLLAADWEREGTVFDTRREA
jgi:RimJ/RimL family protein N-acetyltransferase